MKGNKWSVVIIACLAIFIIVLDSSAMNVAISTLVVELNTTLSTIQSIIALYALIMACFMLLGSKIQDILGRKKTFLTGVLIYGAGSLISALSLNAPMLLVGWAVLEGIGAALMLPATTTIVGAAYSGKDRVTAFGIWGGIGAIGAAVGPIVGGFFTSFITWRLVFGSEIVIVAAILIFRSYLSESKPSLKWKDLDVVGSILSILSLLLIVMGMLALRSPENWAYVTSLVFSGILLFLAFIWWQKRRIHRGQEPLFDIDLFKNRIFTLGNINSVLQQIPLAGLLFIIPVFLQQVTKVDAFMTGVALLPTSIAVFIFSFFGGRLSVKVNPKYIVMAGFLISALGALILNDEFNLSTQIVDIIPGTAIFGIGAGLLLSQLTNLTMSTAREEQETSAAGFLNTSKNLGYSMGTALIGVFLLIGIFNGLVFAIDDSDVSGNMTKEQIESSLFKYVEKMQTSPPPGIPTSKVGEAQKITDYAISYAMKQTFNLLALILFLGFIISIFLPKGQNNKN
ncbi:MAG: MFS transporter [Methanobacterium sp.]|nr:MAG: MFS transporter [Methanobacterium sp.]